MKRLTFIFFSLTLLLNSSKSWGCSFCASKPSPLSSGVPQNINQQQSMQMMMNAAAGQASANTKKQDFNSQPFKQNPNGGQRSENPNWSSSDFFDNR